MDCEDAKCGREHRRRPKVKSEQQFEDLISWCVDKQVSVLIIIALLSLGILSRTRFESYDREFFIMQRTLQKSLNRNAHQSPNPESLRSGMIAKTELSATTRHGEQLSTVSRDSIHCEVGSRAKCTETAWHASLHNKTGSSTATKPTIVLTTPQPRAPVSNHELQGGEVKETMTQSKLDRSKSTRTQSSHSVDFQYLDQGMHIESQRRDRCESSSECSSSKVCVKQVCECPVLFSSEAAECTQPALGFDTGCISPINIPDLELLASRRNLSLARRITDPLQVNMTGNQNVMHLHELGDFSTCAVVGSSSSLTNKKLGAEIDAHSAVIRFNDAPTTGLKEWVGSKTTLRIQNVIYCGFTETPGELCMRYTSKQRGDQIELHTDCKKGWGNCRLVQQTPHLILYAMGYSHLSALHQVDNNGSAHVPNTPKKMSAGFFGIALSLHLCGQVDVYGMDGGEMHYYVKGRNKHNPQQPCTKAGCPSKRSFLQRHNWAEESTCLKRLKEANIPRLAFHAS